MNESYGRDLDLNLLRVFVVVAEEGSVTGAAQRLYVTQPAISAALKRLATAVGDALFARQGRGLVLTARGERLLAAVRPHLGALIDAAFSPTLFDPATSERTIRLGLSDAAEGWLLPPLLRVLAASAPLMRFVVLPVQFRTVGEALASGRVDLAVTVADDLPSGVRREPLVDSGFLCVFDPRHVKLPRRPTLERYLEHEHVIVSYNGDLRGIVEDFFGVTRRVRCSVSTFSAVGGVVDGTALVATVPELVARTILAVRPHLATVPVPLALGGTPIELLSRAAVDDDPAIAFVRSELIRIAKELASRRGRRGVVAEAPRQRRSR